MLVNLDEEDERSHHSSPHTIVPILYTSRLFMCPFNHPRLLRNQVSAALAAASTALASAQAAADKCSGANVLPEFDVGATKKAYEALIDNSDLEAADATRSGRDWVR